VLRRLPTGSSRPALVLAAAGALVLAGCGSGNSGSTSTAPANPTASASGSSAPAASVSSAPAPSGSAAPGASGSAAPSASGSPAPAVTNGKIADVAVTGARNKLPALKFTAPFGVAETVVKTLVAGTGPVVQKNQLATVNYTGVNGRTAKEFDSSVDPQFKHVGAASFQLKDGALVPGFIKGLVGQKVGSRVLVAIPPKDGYGPTGSAQAGITATDTLLFVVDINGAQTPLTMAEGAAVTPAANLPKVTVANGIPTAIAKPAGAAPKAPVTQVLVRGTGKKVAKGDSVSIQALAAVWRTGKLVTNTWQSGGAQSIVVGNGQLIPAADKALLGQPIGSRVMVVATPPLGIQASGDVTAQDSVVFVFDLLAVS